MDDYLHTIHTETLESIQNASPNHALLSIESGKILYFPHYSFKLEPQQNALLSDLILHPKHKNISYNHANQRVAGLTSKNIHGITPGLIQSFMHDFAEYSRRLIDTVLPQYKHDLRWGRTSYRPAEIKGRATSKRKDDTRVHVDSFSATPVNGRRILRVFCNINPYGEPRVWHVGEPFSEALKTFSPQIPTFRRSQAKLLNMVKATKTLRSPYDHYMLKLHDKMKLDEHYQTSVVKTRIEFPAQSTWIVFTDHVSHAALSGQFLLEQTFYLPVTAMLNPEHSPLRQWEKEKGRELV